jgi:hypothetical protein
MQKPCTCEFLYGTMTSNVSKTQIYHALLRTEETQVIVLLYRKDGTQFLCNALIAPVKNEKSEVILFIINFDELNESFDSRSSQSIKRNKLLQQIGMPFISSIFTRNPNSSSATGSTISGDGSTRINDPFSYLSSARIKKQISEDYVEQMLLTTRGKSTKISKLIFPVKEK